MDIKREYLLEMAQTLEEGLRTLYMNNATYGDDFIIIVKDVYERITELENKKLD